MFASPVSCAGVFVCFLCSAVAALAPVASSTQEVQRGSGCRAETSLAQPGWEQPSSDIRLLGFAPGWISLKPLEPVLMQTSAFPKQMQSAYPALPSQPQHPFRLTALAP